MSSKETLVKATAARLSEERDDGMTESIEGEEGEDEGSRAGVWEGIKVVDAVEYLGIHLGPRAAMGMGGKAVVAKYLPRCCIIGGSGDSAAVTLRCTKYLPSPP